ncbi:SPW repeat protein [Mycolicibacterium sp. HS_4_1]
MTTVHSSIEHHPDIMALRAGYDRVSESMAAQATFGLTLMTAVYVALSPWIVDFYGMTRMTFNALIVGGAVALLAMLFGCALDRSHGMTWTLPFFGVWLVISPWIFTSGPTAGLIWSHVASGASIIVLGLCAAYLGMRVRSSDTRHG